jgi:DNA-binding GntR family transcriptional regulator
MKEAFINRDSHISMYLQIANHFEQEILSESLKPNQKLPTEAEIMKSYDVSRITARLALQNLLEKGLVVRKQGKGTFVVDSLLRHELGAMEGVFDSFKAQDIEAKLIEMKVIETPAHVNEYLGDEWEKTLYFRRLYRRKNITLGYSNVYLPEELAQTITWDAAEKLSGYSILTKIAEYNLKHANISIRAHPNTEEQAQILQINQSVPIISLSRITYSVDDKPIEHLSLNLRSDKCEFNFSVPRNFSIDRGIRDTTS